MGEYNCVCVCVCGGGGGGGGGIDREGIYWCLKLTLVILKKIAMTKTTTGSIIMDITYSDTLESVGHRSDYELKGHYALETQV